MEEQKDIRKNAKKDKTIFYMIFEVIIVLAFIWMNTFIHQNSYQQNYNSFTFVLLALIALVSTILIYWIAGDDLPGPFRDTTKGCAVGTAVVSVFLMLALLMDLTIDDGFSIFFENDIEIWRFAADKKYLYDIFAVVWFPYNLSVILSALRRERFKAGSIFYSFIAIMGRTLSGVLIFRPLPNIYAVDLAVLNTITLAIGLWRYVIPQKTVHKVTVMTVTLGYAFIRAFLLLFQCSDLGSPWQVFMIGEAGADYAKAIQEIVPNASFIGLSDNLRNSAYVHEYLVNRNKPMLQILYYFGGIGVVVMVGLLIAFIVVTVKLAGIKNRRKHSGWLVFVTAMVMFLMRAVLGTLYSFGIIYPLSLPFMGKTGCVMDGMALALLLICAWENRRIEKGVYYDLEYGLDDNLEDDLDDDLEENPDFSLKPSGWSVKKAFCVVMIVVAVAAGILGWKWSLGEAGKMYSENSVKVLYQQDSMDMYIPSKDME